MRAFVEKEVIPNISQCVEEAKFPEFLVPKAAEVGFLKYFFKPPYGQPLSTAALGFIVA